VLGAIDDERVDELEQLARHQRHGAMRIAGERLERAQHVAAGQRGAGEPGLQIVAELDALDGG